MTRPGEAAIAGPDAMMAAVMARARLDARRRAGRMLAPLCGRPHDLLDVRRAKRSGRSRRCLDPPVGSSRLCLGPVVTDADVDRESGIEVVRVTHLGAHELTHLGDLDVGHLEQKLVVDLEHEARASSLFTKAPRD